jgi:hypothetical protein
MKGPGQPSGWRGVMNQRPQPSDFGLSQLADNVDSITQRQRVRVSRIRHGIGGGMRINDETELTVSVGSHFSAEFMGRRLSLTAGRVFFGVYATVLATALLIGHVHLRFEIHDMNMQQHALQTVHQRLQRQHSLLDRQNAELVDPGRLRQYAMLNNMVENEQADEVQVAMHLQQKYDPRQIAADRQRREEEALAANNKPVDRFFTLSQVALAFTSHD